MTCHPIGSKASTLGRVLPTGPGKTANDARDQVYRPLNRSLVPVLNNGLRRQIAGNMRNLGQEVDV
jgi:hypothetical protein